MLCVFVLDCAPRMQAPLPLSEGPGFGPGDSSNGCAPSRSDFAMSCFDGAKCMAEAAAAELARLQPNSLSIELALFCPGIVASSALVFAQLDDAVPSTGTQLPNFEKALRNLTARPAPSEHQSLLRQDPGVSGVLSPLSNQTTASIDQCIEEIVDMIDARRAKLETDSFGRGWASWSAMPVHIYILSCSQSLANASQPFVSSSHASPVRVRDLVLPSLSRLYEGRSRWDVHTVVISVGDKSGPALSTLPTVTRALVEDTQGSIIACPSLRSVLAMVAPLVMFARRSATPQAAPVRVKLHVPAASLELAVLCASNAPSRASTESVRWSIPEAFCWRGALDGLMRRPSCPRLRVGTLSCNVQGHVIVGSDISSSQLQELLLIANSLSFPYDCYTVMLPHFSELQGNPAQRQQEQSWEVFFSAVHHGLTEGAAPEVLWTPVFVDQQLVENVTLQEQSNIGNGMRAKDSAGVAHVPGAPSVALLTGMVGVRRGASSASQGGVWEVELILMPPNFHVLLPLLRTAVQVPASGSAGGTNVSTLSQPWRQGMANYMQSVPTYYFAPLSTALKMYSLQLCVPRGSEVQTLSRRLWAHLRRLQARGAQGLGLWAQARRDNEAMGVWSASSERLDRFRGLSRHIDLSKQRETRGIRDVPYKLVGYGDACLPPGEAIDVPSLSRMHWLGIGTALMRRRPKYNGGPDVDPWPVTPCTLLLNPPPELSSGSRVAAISVPLESDDLFSVWERMRRDVFGGSLGLTARRLSVEGCEGTGGKVRAYSASINPGGEIDPEECDRKRRRLRPTGVGRLNRDDAEEWTLWLNALGADLAPRYSSRGMGYYAAVLSRREALRDPHAVSLPGLPVTVGVVPPDEDSPEEQARRKYRVHFGNPFAKPSEDGLVRARRRDASAKLGSDPEGERALFLDGVRSTAETTRGSPGYAAGNSGGEAERTAFLSIFCDTPMPKYVADEPLSLPGPMGEALVVARAPGRFIAEGSGESCPLRPLQLPPLPRAGGRKQPLRGTVNETSFASNRSVGIEMTIPTSPAAVPPSSQSNLPLNANESALIRGNDMNASAPMSTTPPTEAAPLDGCSSAGKLAESQPTPPPSSSWVMRHSHKHNRPYWFHMLDGTSVWTKPPGFD